jgi:uncharacterized protein YndB with AHSA1/START domain
MSDSQDLSKRTLTLERTFNAPIQLVWDAWTQPDHIANWWGPEGMDTTVKTHDFRIGGRWEFVMHMPDGKAFVTEGEYQEIVEAKKIVTTADFKPMTEGVTLYVELTKHGANTHFKFSVVHETEEYCKQQKEMGFYNGWGSTFDRLGEYVTK